MIDLSSRSKEKELMDDPLVPFAAIKQTLKELRVVNRRLGGHRITRKGIENLLQGKRSVRICEIGCGGGDNLEVAYRYCIEKGIAISLLGIDINPECIAYAREVNAELPCDWICSDYARVSFGNDEPDIIFSSLFCHHFTDTELVNMLGWLRQHSRIGFFINDLHRHRLAYYLIRFITRFFSRSYLVKHDAHLSVARSFRRKDWNMIFEKAGIRNYSISWQWAFRFLVICKK